MANRIDKRARFVAAWIVASALPAAIVSFDSRSSSPAEWVVLPTAITLGLLQALVLRTFVDRTLFWPWFGVTAPLAAAAPMIGYLAGFLAYIALGVAALGIERFTGPAIEGPFVLAAIPAGLVAGGAPAVLAQARVLRRFSKRWLWTLPVPGLTYGIAVLLVATDGPSVLATIGARVVLALIYGALTSAVLAPAVSTTR